MLKLACLKILKRRDVSNCSALNASSEKRQGVIVSWYVFKESMGSIVHLIDQAMCDNMRLFVSFSMSVCIHPPMNRVNLRNNGTS